MIVHMLDDKAGNRKLCNEGTGLGTLYAMTPEEVTCVPCLQRMLGALAAAPPPAKSSLPVHRHMEGNTGSTACGSFPSNITNHWRLTTCPACLFSKITSMIEAWRRADAAIRCELDNANR